MSESERLQKISEILLDGAFIRENEIEMADTHLDAVLTGDHTLVEQFLEWFFKINYSNII